MIHTIILSLLWIGIIFCFGASISLCYRRGWFTKQIQTLELISLMMKEIITEIEKDSNKEKEFTPILECVKRFAQATINSQEPSWKDVFRLPKKREKKN